MELEQQVCSYEQAKRLKELGIEQKSILWYHSQDKGLYFDRGFKPVWYVAAFTVAELGVMLPTLGFEFVKSNNGKGRDVFWLSSSYWKLKNWNIRNESEAKARAETLIRLIDAGICTPAEVNQRLNPQPATL